MTSPEKTKGNGEGWWFAQGGESLNDATFYSFIIKVSSICNLNCSYCYVYNMQDQSWHLQPKFMDERTYRVAIRRISEHLTTHGAKEVLILFHGGEPTMLGAKKLQRFSEIARSELRNVAKVRLGVQTNGTLLFGPIRDVIERNQIVVGISVDGSPAQHDKVRVFRNSALGSGTKVHETLSWLASHPSIYGGALTVVNLQNDPIEVYENLVRSGVNSVDFLLPHGSHEFLPPNTSSKSDIRLYGEWLVSLFERWYMDDERTAPNVRLFESIIRLLMGRTSLVETVGLGICNLVVVESNGEIEAVDTLRSCYDGASKTGLSIYRDSFDDATHHPAIRSRLMGISALCQTCQGCPFVQVCGGGYQPHRYSSTNGFLNPSIYCEALMMLIQQIAEHLKADFEGAGIEVPSLVKSLSGRNRQLPIASL